MSAVPFPSPCLSCNRVKDPRDCNNKNCIPWQQWFCSRWEATRQNILAEVERRFPALQGINIGGCYYVPPHRVREYLEQDPCNRCLCSRELCTTACRIRRAWEEARNEVFV